MKCPFCRNNTTEVYNTRRTKFGSQIWRRRRCATCHQAFTTYEAADLGFFRVQTTAGKPQPFSRAKLYSSIYAAFEHSPQRDSDVDAITDTVEAKMLDIQSTSIDSAQIVSITLTALRHFNTTAFIRYLAAHSELATNSQLKRELKKY